MAEFRGMAGNAIIGRSMSEVHPDLAGRMVGAIRRVFASGAPVLRQMLRGRTPLAPLRVCEVDRYRVHRAVGLNVAEMTRLPQLQADLRRIMRELQHRGKNMPSHVIALMNRARREQGNPQDILDTRAQRIRALVHTHNRELGPNLAARHSGGGIDRGLRRRAGDAARPRHAAECGGDARSWDGYSRTGDQRRQIRRRLAVRGACCGALVAGAARDSA